LWTLQHLRYEPGPAAVLADHVEPGQPGACAVLTGPLTSVKEQAARLRDGFGRTRLSGAGVRSSHVWRERGEFAIDLGPHQLARSTREGELILTTPTDSGSGLGAVEA
jgi:hypothetical protein